MISPASYSRKRFINLYTPLEHITMAWCVLFNACHVKNMSHLGQIWRGWFSSSRTTVVSCMWRCSKWTQSALRPKALPRHPPNWARDVA